MQTNSSFFTFLFLIILLGIPTSTWAQEEYVDEGMKSPEVLNLLERLVVPCKGGHRQKSEVSIGIGGISLYIDDRTEEHKVDKDTPLGVYRYTKVRYGGRHYTPTFDISYNRYLLTFLDDILEFSVGGSITGGMSKERRRDAATNANMQEFRKEHIAALIGVRFSVQSELVTYYCGAAGGIDMVLQNDFYNHRKNKLKGAVQVTFGGISIGKKVFGFGELGAGCLGVVRGGIGCRF